MQGWRLVPVTVHGADFPASWSSSHSIIFHISALAPPPGWCTRSWRSHCSYLTDKLKMCYGGKKRQTDLMNKLVLLLLSETLFHSLLTWGLKALLDKLNTTTTHAVLKGGCMQPSTICNNPIYYKGWGTHQPNFFLNQMSCTPNSEEIILYV